MQILWDMHVFQGLCDIYALEHIGSLREHCNKNLSDSTFLMS